MSKPLSTDEVILSHAVSRGVEKLETSAVLSRLQRRLAVEQMPMPPKLGVPSLVTVTLSHMLVSDSGTTPHVHDTPIWPVPIELAAPALDRLGTGVATQQDQHAMMLVRKGSISYDMVAAATAAAMPLVGMEHAGRIPTLTPLEMLTRMHIVLGHAPLQVILATLAQCASLPKNMITRDAIKQLSSCFRSAASVNQP